MERGSEALRGKGDSWEGAGDLEIRDICLKNIYALVPLRRALRICLAIWGARMWGLSPGRGRCTVGSEHSLLENPAGDRLPSCWQSSFQVYWEKPSNNVCWHHGFRVPV